MYIARVSAGYNNNKEAQLLLGKTRNSLYSSCCSTDFQGHPRSMIFISSERARYGDMATSIFLSKTHIFLPPSVQPLI